MKKEKQPAPDEKGGKEGMVNNIEYASRGNKSVITRLKKYGHKAIGLPDFFFELSAFRMTKNEAWQTLFELRDAGDIEYIPFHSIRLKQGGT